MKIEEEKKQLFKAKNTVYQLLKYRPRSEKEIYDKLTEKNFSKNIIDNIISYFKDVELINDNLFTRGWISSRLTKPYGLTRIRYELKQKGIKKEIIKQEIALLEPYIDEENIAINLATKQKKIYTNL